MGFTDIKFEYINGSFDSTNIQCKIYTILNYEIKI